jgi:hypothetical protein
MTATLRPAKLPLDESRNRMRRRLLRWPLVPTLMLAVPYFATTWRWTGVWHLTLMLGSLLSACTYAAFYFVLKRGNTHP